MRLSPRYVVSLLLQFSLIAASLPAYASEDGEPSAVERACAPVQRIELPHLSWQKTEALKDSAECAPYTTTGLLLVAPRTSQELRDCAMAQDDYFTLSVLYSGASNIEVKDFALKYACLNAGYSLVDSDEVRPYLLLEGFGHKAPFVSQVGVANPEELAKYYQLSATKKAVKLQRKLDVLEKTWSPEKKADLLKLAQAKDAYAQYKLQDLDSGALTNLVEPAISALVMSRLDSEFVSRLSALGSGAHVKTNPKLVRKLELQLSALPQAEQAAFKAYRSAWVAFVSGHYSARLAQAEAVSLTKQWLSEPGTR